MQHAIKLLAIKGPVVKIDHPEKREIDCAGIDALVNAAATIEPPQELQFPRQRHATERIAKISDFDTGTQRIQVFPIAPALLIHHRRVEAIDTDMREGVTADLVAAIVERPDLIAIDHTPMRVHVAENSGGDIEGSTQVVLFKDC